MSDYLLKQAGYRCAYCRAPLRGDRWQQEHIYPRSLGGPDTPNNLVAACPRCNLNKGDHTACRDPVTGRTARLFNPLKQQWAEHFHYSDGHVVGKSIIGRATACLLFRSTSQQLPNDLGWWPLREISDETLYEHLNYQRARRLGNRFSTLESEIRHLPNEEILKRVSTKDRRQAQFAAHLLTLETLMMRSREKDVLRGVALAHKLFRKARRPTARAEFSHILSILSQQLATAFAVKGELREAAKLQQQASQAYFKSLSYEKKLKVDQRARYLTVHTKYDTPSGLIYNHDDLRIAIEQAENGQLRSLTYIADAELNFRSQHFDKVARAVDEALKVCGYGQDFDYARSVVLRRRWWVLNMLAGETCAPELLEQDVCFWRSINMHNEIRELSLLLRRAKVYKDRERAIRTLENVVN